MKNDFIDMPITGCVKSGYKRLKKIKKALGITASEEINESMILENVNKHNFLEYYLIQDLIKSIINAPLAVKEQNIKLYNLYEFPLEYKKELRVTRDLYKSHRDFRKYYTELNREFLLSDRESCKYINYWIYELANTFMTDDIMLLPNNVFLNFHFLQYWLEVKTSSPLPDLTLLEELILLYLTSYCSIEILTESGDLDFGHADIMYVNELIYHRLPTKFGLRNINQVMALHYYMTPQISNCFYVENRIHEILNLYEKENIEKS